jgi:hypothetical protein
MAERTEQRTTDETEETDRSTTSARVGSSDRIGDTATDEGLSGSLGETLATDSNAATTDRGLRTRAVDRSSDAARGLLFSFLGATVLWVVATAILPGGSLAGFVGLLAAGFGFGLLGRRRYVELGLAGGVVGAGASLLDFLTLSLLGAGPLVIAAGAGVGLLAAVVGHYFGRDLRDGLSRDL